MTNQIVPKHGAEVAKMSAEWIAFISGFLLGGMAGVLLMSLCFIAKQSDSPDCNGNYFPLGKYPGGKHQKEK